MFRRFLGLDRNIPDTRLPVGDQAEPTPGSAAEPGTARRIVARLEALPPAGARYLACFAYVMSRAAQADLDISDAETALMERFAVQYGGLDESQAVLVVQMAKIQARTQGQTEDYVVTREFREISTVDQRLAPNPGFFALEGLHRTITAQAASVGNQLRPDVD